MFSEYQIDFLPTGKDSVVCLRYGSPEHYRLMVYGGGSAETGRELVRHIREHYGTNVVNEIICSHLDANHLPGLAVILREMEVGELWMHRPWSHSVLMGRHFMEGYIENTRLAAYFEEKMAAAYALGKLAWERGIRLSEPFQGARIGPFTVLSPHHDWYMRTLIPLLENPWPARDAMIPKEEAINAGNASSVVLFGLIAGHGILLTRDTGANALTIAAAYVDSQQRRTPTQPGFPHSPQVSNQADLNDGAPSVHDPSLRRQTACAPTPGDADCAPSAMAAETPDRCKASAAPKKGKVRRDSGGAGQEASQAPMKVVAHAPKSWFLLAEGKDYYLDIICTLSSFNFSLLIKLTDEERLNYETMGLPAIQDIAQKTQRSPHAHYGRNQSFQIQKRVGSAIMALSERAAVT